MKRKLILASTSPRRRTLLKELAIPFELAAPCLPQEELDETLPLALALEKLALEKAYSVAGQVPEAVVLGADTIVCKNGMLLGKPADEAEASHMLHELSGAEHEVITAVAICCAQTGRSMSEHEVSRVRFRELSDSEIADYVASGEPLDKAGAYGIQGKAKEFVSDLRGNFDNVVGLPLALVQRLLQSWEEVEE